MCHHGVPNRDRVMDMSERGVRVLVEAVSRQWRGLLVVGVLDIVVGVAALIWPSVTVLALAVLLGFVLLLTGATLLGLGATARSPWLLVLGVLALVAAVICFVHPGAGVFAILLGCALWFFLNGIAELAAAMSGVAGRIWWGGLGVLSIVAAVIMISVPGVAIVTVAVIAGISFLMRGLGQLALARHLRAVHQTVTGP
jgi:uncharacterized membrane protein HdeD (DUF308 family)